MSSRWGLSSFVISTTYTHHLFRGDSASGQIEGGMVQAAGYGVCEEMAYDEAGVLLNPRFGPYWIYRADDVPDLTTIFVETFEPTHPFGVKAVAEIPMDGVAPALASAIHDATGVWIRELPYTPERVWRALCSTK